MRCKVSGSRVKGSGVRGQGLGYEMWSFRAQALVRLHRVLYSTHWAHWVGRNHGRQKERGSSLLLALAFGDTA